MYAHLMSPEAPSGYATGPPQRPSQQTSPKAPAYRSSHSFNADMMSRVEPTAFPVILGTERNPLVKC